MCNVYPVFFHELFHGGEVALHQFEGSFVLHQEFGAGSGVPTTKLVPGLLIITQHTPTVCSSTRLTCKVENQKVSELKENNYPSNSIKFSKYLKKKNNLNNSDNF